MSKDLNNVNITGRLGKDPDVRYGQSGTAFTSLSVAITTSRQTDNGYVDDTCWADVKCFGKTAENVGQYLRKGSRVAVQGRLVTEKWEDKESGAKRSAMRIVANDVVFLDPPKGVAQPSSTPKSESKADPTKTDEPGFVDDDLPF